MAYLKWIVVLMAMLPALGAAQAFRHPGILLDNETINATRQALAAGHRMKTDALAALRRDPLATPDYQPTPFVQVECGSYDNPNVGCREERQDASAAYAHALLWAYQRDTVHALAAIRIMDAWASTLREGHSNNNAPLQASWAAQLWTRAAELITHTSPHWPAASSQRFGQWLLHQYLPDIQRMGACPGGNWHASSIEARMNIGVFTERRELVDEAVADFRRRLPTYIYLDRDGPTPVPRPGCATPLVQLWHGQTVMVDGLAEETCRDLDHTGYGLAAYINAAQTDHLQGGDLFQAARERLTRAMEFHTDMQTRKEAPAWLCRGELNAAVKGTLEIGHAHYHGKLGDALPFTRAWLESHRPSRGDFHFLWESLTHGINL